MERWIRLIVERPVTVGMLTVAGIVFGLVSATKLPVELLPDISYPSLTVQTELPDAAPEEVEQLVTRPIEQVIGVVGGLKRYTSVSRAGVSEITLEFGWNTEMDLASLDVREKLDLVEFPPDALSPVVYRFDPSLDPIQRVALTGDLPVRDLRKVGEDVLKKKLEVVDGVAAAKVVGGAEEEVRVELFEGRLAALGITVDEVARRLDEENVNRSGGELRDSESAYILRTVKLFESLDDIRDTIIRDVAEGGQVKLSDIGRVFLTSQDREVRVRVDGAPSVEVHLYKEGDANAVHVARGVRSRIESLRDDRLLAGMDIQVLFDQARYIEEAVKNVQVTALIGACLAAIVLFLFLRDLYSTAIIALSIPISIAVTLLLMHLSGISFNIMSLGGLALGIGMLVDNSVVVLEAVARRREEGTKQAEAVILGTQEVVGGIVSSTLTTIAVFLPLIFVEGVSGQLFHDQALTVTFSLLASLFVAITVIPTILARREGGARPLQVAGRGTALLVENLFRPVTWAVRTAMARVTAFYGRTLDTLAQVPWVAPLVGAVLFVAVVPWSAQLGLELVPDLFQGEIFYDMELADGTPLDTTDAKVTQMELAVERLRNDGYPIQHSYVTVGGTPVLGDIRAGDRQDHIGRLNIALTPGTRREDEARLIAALDEELALIPDCPVKLGRPTLFSFRAPIEVEVYSENLDNLWDGARQVTENMRAIPGLIDVRSSVGDRSPEFHVRLDPVKLAASALSQGEVARSLAQMGIGEVPTQYTFGVKPIDIRVQVQGARHGTLQEVSGLTVKRTEAGVPMPLASLGSLEPDYGPVEVRHVGGERAAVITARLEGADLGSASRDVEAMLARTRLHPTVSAKISGQNEEMRSSLKSLAMALGLAVFLVYLVLASSFESLALPFVMVLTVPLGLIGAVLGLFVTGSTVSVFAMIGVILLCGIVVNNAIIYIARILQHRGEGLDRAAAVRAAGTERIRPIFITSATTILGLLPLALGFGAGAELRQPLAVTVIGGLIVATILTLQVVPSGYLILTGGRARAGGES